MSRRDEGSRARGRTSGSSSSSTLRPDTTSLSVEGLTNARTRIVGTRTGPLADLVISIVRLARSAGTAVAGVWNRVSAVVTPLGWVMLLVAPFALIAGYRLGWVELVAVGYAAGVLVLFAAVYLIGRNAFTVALAVPRTRVVVGERATGTVTIGNPTRHRMLGTTVEVPVGGGLAELVIPTLARGTRLDREFEVPTAHRGVLPVGPVRTVRADPIGLVRRELVWTGRSELFVHPRTIGIPSTSTGFIRDLEGNPTRDLSNSDVSFHALREYVSGDERRYIHWKSTAKTGTYMVRQFEETRRSHLVVALSLAASDYASDEEFELAVSVAGSLGVRAIRDTRNLSVVTSERTPEFAKRKVLAVRHLSTLTRSRLLDDLAFVEKADAALAVADVARVTADEIAGISVVFLVCGSPATPAELRAASAAFPAGVEVVAVICDPERVPGLRRIAGLNVLTIGYLEDLQKSLARSAAA
ncbi:MAG TPA: DUF58 domain-containing protein [Lacisediminihabitans sp.]|uniref:DUF58 domain-containing protein n=1 Tax=Lacisediminihabitans sp. TaxID=2787631 RepID=UPI002ED889BD